MLVVLPVFVLVIAIMPLFLTIEHDCALSHRRVSEMAVCVATAILAGTAMITRIARMIVTDTVSVKALAMFVG